jgi:hypothetical protein
MSQLRKSSSAASQPSLMDRASFGWQALVSIQTKLRLDLSFAVQNNFDVSVLSPSRTNFNVSVLSRSRTSFGSMR